MKSSRYNISVDFQESQKRIAFNSISGALLEFSLKDAPLVDQILNNPDQIPPPQRKAKKIKEALIKNGFIIDEMKNELDTLKVENRIARFGPSLGSGLTVAPTLSCNFRCIYCYESHPKKRMNTQVQKALINLVDSEMKEKKSYHITWFGGEPLLAMDIIMNLSNEFIRLAKRHKCKYTAGIITNGYLLNRKNAEKLKKVNVNSVQVTIDGPPDIHDKRRPLAGGKGSFDVIFKNLKQCKGLFNVQVRINVDKNNINRVMELIDLLIEHNLQNNVSPYFGHVLPYTDVCADVESVCFHKKQFSFMETKLSFDMMERGFPLPKYPYPSQSVCVADSSTGKVITPSGAIMKCWNEISNEGAEVDHLLIDSPTPQMIQNYVRYLAWDPFEKTECKKCLALPLCMGGCPYSSLKSGIKSRGTCVEYRYNLKEMIALNYLQKKKREEYEIKNALIERMKKIDKKLMAKKWKNSSKSTSKSGLSHKTP